MRRIFTALTAAAMTVAVAVSGAITAFAKEDVEIDVSKAVESKGWKQSFKLDAETFNPERLSADSQVKIEFSADKEYDKAPVELILLSWDNTDSPNADEDGGVWAKVAPSDFGEGTATFDFDDMAEAYGSKDFKQVKQILIGDTDIAKIKLTKMTITNCIESSMLEDDNASSLSDVKIDCKDAKEASNWGQSMIIRYTDFDTTRMTAKSKIIVDYTIDKKDLADSPCELSFQSWENSDSPNADEEGNVWAKVTPESFTDTQATFTYLDIIEAYGTANFDKVSAVNIGDAGNCRLKCTGITITECMPEESGSHKIDGEAAVTSQPEENSAADESSEAEAASSQEEAQVSSAAEQSSSSSGSNIVFIIIGVVSGIVLAVAVVFIILSKKSDAAYDVNSGEFVSKKKAKK